MKKRNLNYEKKFRAYLFSFDFETHKEICKNLNVQPNIPEESQEVPKNWEYIDEPDTETEVWKNTKTGKYYRVSMERVRTFSEAEEIE